ncbi:hypothetical protein ACE6ED_11725 [Paenibacillus sp. CN-4]|uniref:hypothetical protein n=1 Tax=Paenibacillus nanchangensis TaxID=3348343 RepID=UPI00397C27D6
MSAMFNERTTISKTVGRIALAVMFFAAGLLQLFEGPQFAQMLPPVIPWHMNFVFIGMFLNFVIAARLLFPASKATGYVIALYLALLIPVQIYSLIQGVPLPGEERVTSLTFWVDVLLLPMMMCLALWSSRPAGSSYHLVLERKTVRRSI